MNDTAAELVHDNSVERLQAIARRASTILKTISALLAIGSVVGGYISVTTDPNQYYPGNEAVHFPFKYKLSQFLQGVIPSLAWISVVLAAAYAIQLAGVRLGTRPPAPAVPQEAQPVPLAMTDDVWKR